MVSLGRRGGDVLGRMPVCRKVRNSSPGRGCSFSRHLDAYRSSGGDADGDAGGPTDAHLGWHATPSFVGRRTEDAAGTPGSRYGHLQHDTQRLFDLPLGFSYRVIGRAGDFMDDGLRMPGRADGMAAFPGPDGTTVLVKGPAQP